MILRFLFDEHVNGPAMRILRAGAVDVVHAVEVELASADDPSVFQWAKRNDRMIVTRNYRDFAPLAQAYSARNESFPGVLFLATSIPHSDVDAHVRALKVWITSTNEAGHNPVQNTFAWLR